MHDAHEEGLLLPREYFLDGKDLYLYHQGLALAQPFYGYEHRASSDAVTFVVDIVKYVDPRAQPDARFQGLTPLYTKAWAHRCPPADLVARLIKKHALLCIAEESLVPSLSYHHSWKPVTADYVVYFDVEGRGGQDPHQVRAHLLELLGKVISKTFQKTSPWLTATFWENASSLGKLSLHCYFLFVRARDLRTWKLLAQCLEELLEEEQGKDSRRYHVDLHASGGETRQLRACLCDKWPKCDAKELVRPEGRPLLPMCNERRTLRSVLEYPWEAVSYFHAPRHDKRVSCLTEASEKGMESFAALFGLEEDDRLQLHHLLWACCPNTAVQQHALPRLKTCFLEDCCSPDFHSYCEAAAQEQSNIVRLGRWAEFQDRSSQLACVVPSLLQPPGYTASQLSPLMRSWVMEDRFPFADTIEKMNSIFTYDKSTQKVMVKVVKADIPLYLAPVADDSPVAGLLKMITYEVTSLSRIFPAPEVNVIPHPDEVEEDTRVGVKRKRVVTRRMPLVVYWAQNALNHIGNVEVRGHVNSVNFYPCKPRSLLRMDPEKPVLEYETSRRGVHTLNTWSGLAVYNFRYPEDCTAREYDWGAPEFFSHELQLVLFSAFFTMCGGDLSVWETFVNIVANMIHHPDEPSLKAFVVRGTQGIGKSKVLKAIITQLVGESHGRVVTGNEAVGSKWTDTFGLVALFADEARVHADDLGSLNALITESLVTQQKKHVQPGEVPNFVNLFWATNNSNAIGGITRDARRFVCSSPLDFQTLCGAGNDGGKRLASQFVMAVSKACADPTPSEAEEHPERFGACKALYEFAFFLRHRYDVREWHEKGRFRKAVQTKEFRRLVNLNAGNSSPLEQFAIHLIVTGSNSPRAPNPVKRRRSEEDPSNAALHDPEWSKRKDYEDHYGYYKPKGSWFRFVPLTELHEAYIAFVRQFQLREVNVLQEIQFGQELAALFAGVVQVGTLSHLIEQDPELDVPLYLQQNFWDKHFVVFSEALDACRAAVSRVTGAEVEINSREKDVLCIPDWFAAGHEYTKLPMFLRGKIFTKQRYNSFPRVAMFAHYKWTQLCEWFDLQKRKWQGEAPPEEEEEDEEEDEEDTSDAEVIREGAFLATHQPPGPGTPTQEAF